MMPRVVHTSSDPVCATGTFTKRGGAGFYANLKRWRFLIMVVLMGSPVLLISSGCGNEGFRSGIMSHPPTAVFTNSLGMKFLPLPASHGSLLSVWETRVRDFAAFVDDSNHDATGNFYYHRNYRWNCDTNYWRYPGFEQTPEHPVVGVSWGDAMAFCHWLTEHERALGIIDRDQTYRLPSNREWNLASMPGSVWPIPTNSANYSPQLKVDSFYHTAPVGSFPPNAHGFHDLTGNVWEFCIDRVKDEVNYVVIRGGSWQNWHQRFVGTHARGSCGAQSRIAIYGFRVILVTQDQRTTTIKHDNQQQREHEGT